MYYKDFLTEYFQLYLSLRKIWRKFLANIVQRMHEDITSGPSLVYGYWTMILHILLLPLVPNITHKLGRFYIPISPLVQPYFAKKL